MPLAQSSELPPPTATIESTPHDAAYTRPVSTMRESGLASKWRKSSRRRSVPAAASTARGGTRDPRHPSREDIRGAGRQQAGRWVRRVAGARGRRDLSARLQKPVLHRGELKHEKHETQKQIFFVRFERFVPFVAGERLSGQRPTTNDQRPTTNKTARSPVWRAP